MTIYESNLGSQVFDECFFFEKMTLKAQGESKINPRFVVNHKNLKSQYKHFILISLGSSSDSPLKISTFFPLDS